MSQQTFDAELQSIGPAGAWTRVSIPFDVPVVFGTRARVPVKGTINSHPFRSSLFPNGDGTFHMMVNRQMRDGAGARPGETVHVILEQDTHARSMDLPPDFQQALVEHRESEVRFAALAPSHRKAYIEWIVSAKQEQTRRRRIDKAIEMIATGRNLN